MKRIAAEEVRLVAYFGKTPDPTPSAKSRYEWELAGDDALTPAAESALVDNLRKRVFGQRTVGLVVRIPLFGKSPVSFSGVTMQDLAKKLQGEVSNLVAPSGGSRTISHPMPTNLPEAPQGTMLREFAAPAPDPDSLTSRTTKLAASLPHGSTLRRFLVATVKAACPGHLGNPMQVPPQLSRAHEPSEVSCGTCDYFCPTRNVCKMFGDYPVSADMVCSAWEGEVEAPAFGAVDQPPLRYAATYGLPSPYEVGDVFRGFFGSSGEMSRAGFTVNPFFQVVRVTPKQIVLRRLQTKTISEQSGEYIPVLGRFDPDSDYLLKATVRGLPGPKFHDDPNKADKAMSWATPLGINMNLKYWDGKPAWPPLRYASVASTKVAKGTPRSFLERNPTAQVEVMPEAGITVIRYSGAKTGKPAAAVYSGKSENPLWDYFFGNEHSREQYIADQVEKSKAAMSVRQERAQAKREFQHGLKDGDILYSSWGYDQTNVNWYEVVGVVGKQVLLREIDAKVVSGGRGSESVVPVPGHYDGAVLKKIPQRGYNGQPYVKINASENAYPWDGKPKHRTAWGFGH